MNDYSLTQIRLSRSPHIPSANQPPPRNAQQTTGLHKTYSQLVPALEVQCRSPPRRPGKTPSPSLRAMDLTFTRVRKPQEVFEKGSKGTGRRRGLPAPLQPTLLLKSLKGPFPRGAEVPRVAPRGEGPDRRVPSWRGQTGTSGPSPAPKPTSGMLR